MRYCPLCGRRYSGSFDLGQGEKDRPICFECHEEYGLDYDEETYKLLWTFHNLRNRKWTEEEW